MVKKIMWPINALTFNLCRLLPFRNNNIWIFGGWEGRKYDDNSRYLFEYINEVHKNDDIRTIWISKEIDIISRLRERGYEACLSNSVKGKWLSLRAGVAVYSHGLIDFGSLPLVGGATIVSLWHGVGFKKIYNAKYAGWKLFLKKTLDKIFSWTYRDVTIVTSEYIKRQFSSIFGLTSKDIIEIAGQPRNDIFKTSLQKKDILNKIDIDYGKQFVIYMPTYRGKAMGADAMSRIIVDLYNNDKLDKALKDTNSVFIAKLHPLTPHIDLPNRNNFIILDYGAVESNQKLLGISDMLITDYSSCCVDFALLERPIVFYTPDRDEFINKSEPLFEDLFPIIDLNRCDTPDELADKLLNPSNAAVEKLNELFEDKSIKGTCYSENVYNLIKKQK